MSGLIAALLTGCVLGAVVSREAEASSAEFSMTPLSVSARAAGGTYAGVDAFTPFQNPALLGFAPRVGSAQAADQVLFGGAQSQYGLAASYMSLPGVSGAYGAALLVGGYSAEAIKELDGSGNATGVEVSPSGTRANLALAYQWKWFSVGAAAGMAKQSFGGVSSGGKELAPQSSLLSVGAALELGAATFGGSLRTAGGPVATGTLVTVGGSFLVERFARLRLAGEGTFRVGEDLGVQRLGGATALAGVTWMAHRMLDVQLGALFPGGLGGAHAAPAGGIAVHWRDWSLHYALQLPVTAALGSSHAVQVGWRFGAERVASVKVDSAVPPQERVQPPVAEAETRSTLAVSAFDAQGVSASDAAVIADLFRNELAKLGAFNMVEKSNMDKILAEQTFQQTGCTTAECAVKLGKLLNVKYLMVGSFGKLMDAYVLNVRLVEIESAKVVFTDGVEAISDQKEVTAAVRAMSSRLSKSAGRL